MIRRIQMNNEQISKQSETNNAATSAAVAVKDGKTETQEKNSGIR
jgi:hypothetical protein